MTHDELEKKYREQSESLLEWERDARQRLTGVLFAGFSHRRITMRAALRKMELDGWYKHQLDVLSKQDGSHDPR